jgi:hypothetical protein
MTSAATKGGAANTILHDHPNHGADGATLARDAEGRRYPCSTVELQWAQAVFSCPNGANRAQMRRIGLNAEGAAIPHH